MKRVILQSDLDAVGLAVGMFIIGLIVAAVVADAVLIVWCLV